MSGVVPVHSVQRKIKVYASLDELLHFKMHLYFHLKDLWLS